MSRRLDCRAIRKTCQPQINADRHGYKTAVVLDLISSSQCFGEQLQNKYYRSQGFPTEAPRGFFRLNSAMNAAVTSTVGNAVRTAGNILLTSSVIVIPFWAAKSSKALPICCETGPMTWSYRRE